MQLHQYAWSVINAGCITGETAACEENQQQQIVIREFVLRTCRCSVAAGNAASHLMHVPVTLVDSALCLMTGCLLHCCCCCAAVAACGVVCCLVDVWMEPLSPYLALPLPWRTTRSPAFS